MITKKQKTIIASVVVLLLVLAGVLTLIYLNGQRTRDIIGQAKLQLSQSSSFKIDAEVTWDGARLAKPEKLSLVTSGPVIRQSGRSVMSDQKFNLLVEASRLANVAGSWRRVNGRDFVRLSSSTDTYENLNIPSLVDNWNLVNIAKNFVPPQTPLFFGAKSLGEDGWRYAVSEFVAMPFLEQVGSPSKEGEGATAVYHLKVRLAPILAAELVKRVESARLGQDVSPDEKNSIEIFFNKINPEVGDLYVDYYSLMPRSLDLPIRYQGSNRTGLLRLKLRFSSYGQKFEQVVQPEITKVAPSPLASDPSGKQGSLSSAGIFFQPTPSSVATPTPASVASDTASSPVNDNINDGDFDGDGVSDGMERFYGTDALNPDTNGNGLSDSEDIVADRSPLTPFSLYDFTGGTFQ